MRYSEIIATVKEMGEITEDRKQTISLEDVSIYTGDYLVGETVKIYICDSETSKVIDSSLKKYKEKK